MPAARFLPILLVLLPILTEPVLAQRESPFMDEFRKLMQIHAQDEMGALIKKNEPAAILAVIETCEAIGAGSNDTLEDEIAALDKAWRKAYESKFVDIQYRYFSLDLQPQYKRHRRELIDRYLVKRREYDGAVEEKAKVKFPGLGLEFQAFGDEFSELGDHYMAAQSYRVYATCFDDGLNSTDKADYKRACEGWSLFLASREKIELRDRTHNEAKTRFDQLEFDGYGDPTKGPEARAAARAASDSTYQPRALEGSFELLENIEAIQRPHYMADLNFQIWAAVALGAVDSKGTIPTMENSPSILRVGSAKVVVDVDGDGTGDVDVPLTGKPVPVEITLGSGDQERKWAFLAAIGQAQDTYQGFRYNTGPDENQMSLYVAPAASLVTTIEEVRVQFIDDNFDGLFGSPPKDWAYTGLVDGSFQRDVDSVVIGESKVAVPWSRLMQIGEKWFVMESSEEGNQITATLTDVETGTLQLDLKGPSVSWLIVRGTGNNNDLYYDVCNGGKKKVEVPIGTYEVYVGQVAEGKKAQMMKSLILPGANSRSWGVRAGESVKMELGAPFTFDFKVGQDQETVRVEGASIVIKGRGGESYQRFWNCVPKPELSLRKAGSKKGKKEAKLQPVSSQEELEDQKYDFRTAWFPVSDPIPKTIPGETFEVQLFEKKNKLFGKVESDWKAD